jgi:predicted DNA binding protein
MKNNDFILNKLSELPQATLEIAYLYAVNLSQYGVDVANKWLTAVQQNEALNRAYERGYYDALKRIEKVQK